MHHWSLDFAKVLCDLGASITLIPLSIFKKLGLGNPKSNVMQFLMEDRTRKRPIVVLHEVLVKVDSFICTTDFPIFDFEEFLFTVTSFYSNFLTLRGNQPSSDTSCNV